MFCYEANLSLLTRTKLTLFQESDPPTGGLPEWRLRVSSFWLALAHRARIHP